MHYLSPASVMFSKMLGQQALPVCFEDDSKQSNCLIDACIDLEVGCNAFFSSWLAPFMG